MIGIRAAPLVFIILLTNSARAQSELLPDDAPVIATVVHGIKYPVGEKYTLDLAFGRYYEDRLASTWALGIAPKYHISEKLFISLPIFVYTSSLADGVSTGSLSTSNMEVLEPRYSGGPVVGYNPIYGKFLLGESIQHFRAGFNGGLALMQMQNVGSGSIGQISYGAQLGVQLTLQFGPNWTADVFSTAHIHHLNGIQDGEFQSFRLGWLYGLSVGRVF